MTPTPTPTAPPQHPHLQLVPTFTPPPTSHPPAPPQAIKAVAIARQYVEEEAIDLCCRPSFVELNDVQLGDGQTVHPNPSPVPKPLP